MKFQLSKNCKYAEKWFKDNGYEFELTKQYISKTIWHVKKDNVEDIFELPSGVEDIKSYMKFYKESFEMKTYLINLKSQL